MFNTSGQVRKTQAGQFSDTYHIVKGSRVVIVYHDKEFGGFTYRLYLNNGEDASLNHGKSKTAQGVNNFCQKHLN